MLWQEYFDFVLHVGRYGNTAILLQAENSAAKIFLDEASRQLKSFCFVYRLTADQSLTFSSVTHSVLTALSLVAANDLDEQDAQDWLNKTARAKQNVVIVIEKADQLSKEFLQAIFLLIKLQQNKTTCIHFLLQTEIKKIQIKLKNWAQEIDLPDESFCYFSLEKEKRAKEKKIAPKKSKSKLKSKKKISLSIPSYRPNFLHWGWLTALALSISCLSVYFMIPSEAQKQRSMDAKKAMFAVRLNNDRTPQKFAAIYTEIEAPDFLNKNKNLSPSFHWWYALTNKKNNQANLVYYPEWGNTVFQIKEIKLLAYEKKQNLIIYASS